MLIQESLEELKEQIAQMTDEAVLIFDKAVAMIHSRNESILPEIKEMDKLIDEMEMKLDKHCMELLLKEPYAIDFRYVFSSVKTIKDIERIGDECKSIAKWSFKLKENISAYADINDLEQKTREAFYNAINSLKNLDAELASKVMENEFQVDEIEDKIIESSTEIAEAFIAKALERIGDLATNIAENVIFCVKAKDVRHGGF